MTLRLFSILCYYCQVLYSLLRIYLDRHLFLSHIFAFWENNLILRFAVLQIITLVSFQVTLEMLVRELDLQYRWRNGTPLSEEVCLLSKILRWWVLYFVSIFIYLFIWIWGKKTSSFTKEELLSKNLEQKFGTKEELWAKGLKEQFPLAMQLQKFHFSPSLLSSQTRKLHIQGPNCKEPPC